jgi:D-3-phosphoglycerate dehydrogenase
MSLVAVTDAQFAALDVESAVLAPMGVELTKGADPSAATLKQLVAQADAVITQFAPVTAEVIEAMQRARVIVRYGIGVDNVDLEAAHRAGIPVCNVPDYCIDEVADHTLALMLSISRRIDVHAASIRDGQWKLVVPFGAMRSLRGATVGIVGFGRIGREVARRLAAFGCKLLVFDPVVTPEVLAQYGAKPAALATLLAESDAVTLHCPSTAETRRLINANSLATMKRGAILVNVSRGDLVEPQALLAALESGQLGGAGLDVTDPEPLPTDSALRTLENVVITPHIASVSEKAVRTLRESVAKAAAVALRGELPPNVVNRITTPRKIG